MPNYDWREFRYETLFNRYPNWVLGRDQLRDLFYRVDESFDEVLFQIAIARRDASKMRASAGFQRPTVFISHRKDDVDEAERIAYLACQSGFDYWLDIYDPALAGYPGLATATPQEARVAALIIEMALLNATQVIAVVTPQTAGSTWVPYEYGRVKDPVPDSPQAACWLCPTVTLFPEYLYLGQILKSEIAISAWLKSERRRMGYTGAPTCTWTGGTTNPL